MDAKCQTIAEIERNLQGLVNSKKNLGAEVGQMHQKVNAFQSDSLLARALSESVGKRSSGTPHIGGSPLVRQAPSPVAEANLYSPACLSVDISRTLSPLLETYPRPHENSNLVGLGVTNEAHGYGDYIAQYRQAVMAPQPSDSPQIKSEPGDKRKEGPDDSHQHGKRRKKDRARKSHKSGKVSKEHEPTFSGLQTPATNVTSTNKYPEVIPNTPPTAVLEPRLPTADTTVPFVGPPSGGTSSYPQHLKRKPTLKSHNKSVCSLMFVLPPPVASTNVGAPTTMSLLPQLSTIRLQLSNARWPLPIARLSSRSCNCHRSSGRYLRKFNRTWG